LRKREGGREGEGKEGREGGKDTKTGEQYPTSLPPPLLPSLPQSQVLQKRVEVSLFLYSVSAAEKTSEARARGIDQDPSKRSYLVVPPSLPPSLPPFFDACLRHDCSVPGFGFEGGREGGREERRERGT